MSRANTQPRLADLERLITQRIKHRAGERIRALRVEVVEDRVVVHGRAATFFLKQLALQGVFDVLGPRCPTRIHLNVQVADSAGTDADLET